MSVFTCLCNIKPPLRPLDGLKSWSHLRLINGKKSIEFSATKRLELLSGAALFKMCEVCFQRLQPRRKSSEMIAKKHPQASSTRTLGSHLKCQRCLCSLRSNECWSLRIKQTQSIVFLSSLLPCLSELGGTAEQGRASEHACHRAEISYAGGAGKTKWGEEWETLNKWLYFPHRALQWRKIKPNQ